VVRATGPGDLVLFQFDKDSAADHIGIIEKDNGDTITTIEGNTSTTSDDNGGAVMRRTRKKSLIMAVARPAYPSTITVEVEQLEKGARSGSVRPLQLLLIGSGMSCGGSGADGIFGAGTENAVKAFQRHHGLTVDGIAGKKTWDKLLIE
jgi:peptidoglycan hydrolase-like protein with peptidoglycan-binding domain